MSYTVRVLSKAQQDVEDIYVWLYERSPQGAKSWFRRFAEARDALSMNPERCPAAPESAAFSFTIRELLFKTRRGHKYRLLFTIVEAEVHVLRVRGPGQELITPSDV